MKGGSRDATDKRPFKLQLEHCMDVMQSRGKKLKHYMLKTYDDIVEIACRDYKMTI